MIIGATWSPHAAVIETTTDSEFFSAKDLLDTILKKTGVSFMLPTSASAYFPIFKNLAHIS